MLPADTSKLTWHKITLTLGRLCKYLPTDNRQAKHPYSPINPSSNIQVKTQHQPGRNLVHLNSFTCGYKCTLHNYWHMMAKTDWDAGRHDTGLNQCAHMTQIWSCTYNATLETPTTFSWRLCMSKNLCWENKFISYYNATLWKIKKWPVTDPSSVLWHVTCKGNVHFCSIWRSFEQYTGLLLEYAMDKLIN